MQPMILYVSLAALFTTTSVLRIFFTYSLLLALTLQSFYRTVMTLEYEIHLSDYIAQCINRDRPELHCNGQCVLMKKIREEEKKEAKKNLVVYEYSALYLHKDFVVFTPSLIEDVIVVTHFSPYHTSYRFNHNDAVFRPPIA